MPLSMSIIGKTVVMQRKRIILILLFLLLVSVSISSGTEFLIKAVDATHLNLVKDKSDYL